MTPAAARAMYRRQIAKHGEAVALRRTGQADYTVRGRATRTDPSDVTGSVQQSGRTIIVLAEDVAAVGFPLPFQANIDRLVWNGVTQPILYADDTKRRVAGELIAFELHVAGA